MDIQLQQLATDPFSAPQWIFSCQALDERDRVGAEPMRLFLTARFEPPKQAEALAMPAQQSIRLDDLQGLLPILNATRDAHRDNSDNRWRQVRRGVFTWRCNTINC